MQFKYHARMPEEHGCYWFNLKDGSKIYGYYSSFAHPHTHHIRVADLEGEEFYYVEEKEIIGHYVL